MKFATFLELSKEQNTNVQQANAFNINNNVRLSNGMDTTEMANNSLDIPQGDKSLMMKNNDFLVVDETAKRPEQLEQFTDLRSNCIIIDSRDRDRSYFPNSNKFCVYFNPEQSHTGAALFQNFKNIYSVRLVEAVLPSVVQNSAYVSLVIPEVYEHVAGTNDILRKSFAILIPERVVGNFVHCRIRDNIYCCKKFLPAKANFNKWTIELYQSDGTFIDLGTDTSPSTAPDSTVQATLIFELTTVEHNRSKIVSNIV
jgi:hypothetical protein